jgi:hypothetical protein
MSLNLIVRKAHRDEIDILADIAFVAWERDLQPFLNGPAAAPDVLEGADRIQLDTLADNVRAVNFYQHQGYSILALRQEGAPGRDPQMGVRLEKLLSPWRGPISDIE